VYIVLVFPFYFINIELYSIALLHCLHCSCIVTNKPMYVDYVSAVRQKAHCWPATRFHCITLKCRSLKMIPLVAWIWFSV